MIHNTPTTPTCIFGFYIFQTKNEVGSEIRHSTELMFYTDLYGTINIFEIIMPFPFCLRPAEEAVAH